MPYASRKIKAYLEQYKDLPHGCKLYQLSVTGKMFVAGEGKVQEVSRGTQEYANQLHVFINPGNLAYYLLGNPETSEQNPNNATAKVGITDPHHHFIPHAHGVEHYVFSQGFSGCLLFNHAEQKAFPIKLLPGSLIYISAMIPHSFYNRSDVPLITLIANGGLGIHHEKYAVTKELAEASLQKENDPEKRAELTDLSQALGSIEEYFVSAHPERDLSLNERVARKLYRLAEHFGLSQ
jgi:mannose-6-phosphate isomerase-like protein (cupin superfamily)